MGARDIDFAEINIDEQNFFFVRAGFGQDLAGGAGDETLPPEFNARAAGGFLQADSIGHRDVTAVSHCVTALNDLPRAVLKGAVFHFFFGMPTDGGGIK